MEHFIKDLGIALAESSKMGLSLPGLALAHQLYVAVKVPCCFRTAPGAAMGDCAVGNGTSLARAHPASSWSWSCHCRFVCALLVVSSRRKATAVWAPTR